MNTVIADLMEQAFDRCKKYDDEGSSGLVKTTEAFAIFAELIVLECLSDLKDRIAIRYQGSDRDCDIGYGMEIVYWEIVDKFGVEV